LVSVVRPANFAVTLRKAPDGGVLTFSQRLVVSKKQTTENWIGAAFAASYTDVSTMKWRGLEGSTELLSLEGTEPMMDTIGHHCSGKCWRYSSKSVTSPGCLEG
jgi:hypothetical protein